MLTKTEEDVLYLIRCGALNQTPSTEKVNQMAMKDVYNLCTRHSVAAFVAYTLEQMKQPFDMQEKWKETYMQAIHYRMVMDNIAKELFEYLEDQKCWYMPLKGYVLKDLYPAYGTRQMGDLDVLFDPKFRKMIYSYFTKKGFTAEDYKKSNHDVYKKDRYMVEMHVNLFLHARNPEQEEFFRDIIDKSEKIDDTYQYKMGPELFYTYLVAHAYKHFEKGGAGIRLLVDLYYVLLNFDINPEKVCTILQVINVTEFEHQLHDLVLHFFKDESLSVEESTMLEFMLHSGTHGTFEHQIEHGMKNADQSTWKYYLKRFFPSKDWWVINYPFVGKHPVFIPFVWVYRLLVRPFINRKKLMEEYHLVRNLNKKDDKIPL